MGVRRFIIKLLFVYIGFLIGQSICPMPLSADAICTEADKVWPITNVSWSIDVQNGYVAGGGVGYDIDVDLTPSTRPLLSC